MWLYQEDKSTKYRLLAVDDNKMVLALIRATFASELDKYSIITAENGRDAYELAVSHRPDLILLDVEMPEVDGFECLNRLKQTEETNDIPVIMITGTRNLSQAFEAGATDFIHKPIDKTELLVRVKSTLSLYKLLRGIIKQSEELEYQSEMLENQKQELELEKKKTDELLLNILPYEIAEQLKNKGSVKPKLIRMATVLFTDFKDFTRTAESLSTEDLIKELGVYFEKFDEISELHFVEKIKTIGDSYMCAGGLPIRNRSNPIDVTLVGLRVQKFMQDYNNIKRSLGQPTWELRVGVHTGEVIAGVIGKKKFAYDIWGDTVNTASRMESAGAPGKVNVSSETYKHIKDFFVCTHRGKISVKSKGEIDMYFVERLRPEYSEDEDGVIPNKKFKEIHAQI